MKLASYDPSNGELLGELNITTSDEISTVVAKAKQAQQLWSQYSLEQRQSVIKKAYSNLQPYIERLATLLSQEMGKDIDRATAEVRSTVFGGPFYALEAKKALLPKHADGQSTIEYRPLGVAAVISPWNYPLAMANNLIVPALMAGNSVVFKPSEETPLVADMFISILTEGLPQHLVQIIHGDGKVGQNLVASDIDIIAFTGSQAVGKQIMKTAATSLKRLVMELGGNDAMIVLNDANLNAAAQFAVASSFENAGQMCISTERVYVDEQIADAFEQKVVELAKRYQVGPWHDSNANIGPIINSKQHQRIVDHIEDAITKGAKRLFGNEQQTKPYIKPTVLTNLTEDMLMVKEETFGPVLAISRFNNKQDAINNANNTSYGLGAVVFGERDAKSVASQLQAGMIGINRGVGGSGDTPWVGAKQSGFGYHGGPDGHRQFAQVTVVS